MLYKLYGTGLELLADLYALTSAYVLWKEGKHETPTVFHYFHRNSPFEGGYAIAAGTAMVADWVTRFEFDSSDIDFLADLEGNDGQPLFPECEFLHYLHEFKFKADIDAVPEGTVIFPHEPVLRSKGTIFENLILEAACLNMMNSQTLWATKAARICEASGGQPVLEFGLRRAQGIDGALSASRAAYIGGVSGTSNLLAARLFGIPVKGTHQHAFVMFHDSELEAFHAYAKHMPHNAVFLVDTYGTLQGVKHAIEAAKVIKTQGCKPVGIRLDSGDLAYLSIEARKMLDAAGLHEMQIVASNDLDENLIKTLRIEQAAAIGIWGVGTKLVTSYDQPAFGGVFKLGAMMKNGSWVDKIKISEQTVKTTNPGILDAVRFEDGDGRFIADMIRNIGVPPYQIDGEYVIVDPLDATRQKRVSVYSSSASILKRTIVNGKVDADFSKETLEQARARCKDQLSRVHPGVRRFTNPHQYPAGLDLGLHRKKIAMMLHARDAQF